MFMPSIFGENLFDAIFDGFANPDRMSGRPGKFAGRNAMMMKTDVKESDTAFDIDVELPGYKKEDVKAELKDGYLTITADKCETNEAEETGKYIRKERFCGSCSRSFYVGEDVTQNDIRAKFEDGILKLMVPKIEKKPEPEENHFIAIEG